MSKTAAEILAECQAHGIILQPLPGGRLDVDGPAGELTPELLQRLRDHKAELLALLAGGTQDGRPEGQDHGAGDPQDLQPIDGDAAKWQPYSTPDGRCGIVRDDLADMTIIDLPTPCSGCGGIERWQDLTGTWRCPVCSPPGTRAALLRLQAAAARTRHPVTRDRGTTPTVAPRTRPAAVPVGILADSVTTCSGCGRVPVVPGQPGRPVGLCFSCWTRRPRR